MRWYWETGDGVNTLVTEYEHGEIAKTEVAFYVGESSTAPNSGASVHVVYKDGKSVQWHCLDLSSYNGQFGVSVSFDGELLFVQTWHKGILAYEAETGKLRWRSRQKTGITTVFLNQTALLVHQHEKALQLLDQKTGTLLKEKKPARDWSFYPLDEERIICRTTAKQWELIRAEDLETVGTIPAKLICGDAEGWCVQDVFLVGDRVRFRLIRTKVDSCDNVSTEYRDIEAEIEWV